MPTNPCYSVRVSPQLQNAIANHQQKTGETNTEILLNALTLYLADELPDKIQHPLFKQLNALAERVESLEQSSVPERLAEIESEFNEFSQFTATIIRDLNQRLKTLENAPKSSKSKGFGK